MANKDLYSPEKVIAYHAKRAARTSPFEYDDLFQIGYEGYLKAQEKFNPAFGHMSLTYASQYIKWYIDKAHKQEYKFRNTHYTVDDIYDTLEYQQSKNEEHKADAHEEMAYLETIKSKLDQLPITEQYIIRQLYFTNKPPTEVALAARLGFTKQNVNLLKNRGLAKLKEMVKHEI